MLVLPVMSANVLSGLMVVYRRGRQDRGVRSVNGNFDRRGGHDDRRGNVGNVNRRRDRNDTRTGRR